MLAPGAVLTGIGFRPVGVRHSAVFGYGWTVVAPRMAGWLMDSGRATFLLLHGVDRGRRAVAVAAGGA